jgi:riboflavin synthase
MFTGIIKEVGKVYRKEPKFVVKAEKIQDTLNKGDSVSVNGVCLTLEELNEKLLQFHLSAPTLKDTNLGKVCVGEAVNLEPPLSVGDSLGGHFVAGHVDSMVRLLSKRRKGEEWEFEFSIPKDIKELIIPKGAVAIDGVSLTVQRVSGSSFYVAIVPFTYKNTNLCCKRVGDYLNLEVDMIARYIKSLLKDGVCKH